MASWATLRASISQGPYMKWFWTADWEGEASESHVKETVPLVMEESNLNMVPIAAFLYIM